MGGPFFASLDIGGADGVGAVEPYEGEVNAAPEPRWMGMASVTGTEPRLYGAVNCTVEYL